MTQRRIDRIPADDLWREWRDDIERITTDTDELFTIRRQFREIAGLFEGNRELQTAGGNLWLWLLQLYASTVLMRLRREVDTQGNTINLRTLIEEIEKRPDVVTRRRIAERNTNISPMIAERLDQIFTERWAEPGASGNPEDRIDPEKVRNDRLALEGSAVELDNITSRTIAHRTRGETKTTVEGVDLIFNIVETLLKKYRALLTGAALMAVEPEPQCDTMAPFMFRWHPEAYTRWKQLGSGNDLG